MADRTKGLTVVLGGDTTGLNKALADTNRQIKGTQAQLRDVEKLLKMDPQNTELLTQKQRLLAQAVDQTEDKLRALRDAEQQVQQQFKKGKVSQAQYDALKREIIETESRLDGLRTSAKQTEKAIDGIDESPVEEVKKAADKAGDSLGDAGDAADSFGEVLAAGSIIEGVKGLVSAVGDLREETAEYRKIMGTLDVSSSQAGYSAEETAASYNKLYGVLGDDQATATTVANLQAIGLSQDQLTRLIDISTGAWASYGDSIPIDGLAEAINETIRAGQVTGTLADVLNWGSKEGETFGVQLKRNIQFTEKSSKELKEMTDEQRAAYEAEKERYEAIEEYNEAITEAGTAEDMFNIALQNCTSESERANLVLRALSMQGLERTGQAWVEQNEAVVEANDAQREFIEGTAELSEKLEPANQAIQEGKNQLLGIITEIVGKIDMDKLAETIGKIFDAIGTGITFLVENKEAVLGFLAAVGAGLAAVKGAGFIASLQSGVGLLGSLSTLLPSLAPMFALLANPVFLVTAAVVALVAAIAIFGDEIQAKLQEVDDWLQGVFATDFTEIFGPVLGEAMNATFATVKNVWDAIKRVFDGIIDFIRGIFTGDWERAWQGVQDIFGGIFEGSIALAKAPLNAIIGLINGMIGSVNWVIEKINNISFKNPFTGRTYGFNIGYIGDIPYLAKGGILSQGAAIVGEAGPEILSMQNGKAVVQPLNSSSTTTNHNLGGVNITVYGAPGQDVHQLADILMDEMQYAVRREEAVYG